MQTNNWHTHLNFPRYVSDCGGYLPYNRCAATIYIEETTYYRMSCYRNLKLLNDATQRRPLRGVASSIIQTLQWKSTAVTLSFKHVNTLTYDVPEVAILLGLSSTPSLRGRRSAESARRSRSTRSVSVTRD
jgi:hypothetical protein